MIWRPDNSEKSMQRLLTQADAAEILRLSQRTLERFRVSGLGPRFVKAGHSVRYREADLDAWVASRVVESTSELMRYDK
jgi:predicted DNA-binding transcriptional regulator AlpA